MTVELRSSRDNFGVDDVLEAAATVGQSSFAAVLPVPITRRFWRVRFAGENPGPVALGEVVLGLLRRLVRAPEYPLGLKTREPTERDETAAGEVYVRLLSAEPPPADRRAHPARPRTPGPATSPGGANRRSMIPSSCW